MNHGMNMYALLKISKKAVNEELERDEMIRIAIVEDEAAYAEQLEGFLHRYEEEKKEAFEITRFSDGDSIVHNYKAKYDIILMDIQMKFMDGMSAAGKIRKSDTEVIIIFITNMRQYAILGYAVDALDYVVKPISYFAFSERLGKAIERIHRRVRLRTEKFCDSAV